MSLEERIENISWASVGLETTLDRHGRDVAVVVAKMAYTVSFQGKPKLALAAVRRGEIPDIGGSIRFPADLEADEKPGTDVALVGTAYPPVRSTKGRAYAWVSMGPLRKVVAIHGPRFFTKDWRGNVVPSDPGPLVEPVPLRYDLTFGGTDPTTGTHEPRNPLGMGFSSQPAKLIGQPVAPLEPATLQEGGGDAHPSHGCFAPISAHWEPRRSRIGTHDAAWAKHRAPVRPRDFDPLHNCWATPNLYSATPLVGDELVEVGGVLPEGVWKFKLPRYEVNFGSRVDGQMTAHPTHLDSVLIDADKRAIELCFRASILLPRKWQMLERIVVLGVGTLPEEVIRGPEFSQGVSPAEPARARSV